MNITLFLALCLTCTRLEYCALASWKLTLLSDCTSFPSSLFIVLMTDYLCLALEHIAGMPGRKAKKEESVSQSVKKVQQILEQQ